MGQIGHFDTIICGGGHAGCEAALAAARTGAKTLLITHNIDTIAKMSCNPAIGGLAKGNIVREIDALGGEMAINTDATAIQFRLLNRSKGPAVQGPRAQCDKDLYCMRMRNALISSAQNLKVFQAIVEEIIVKNGIVIGVTTDIGTDIFAKTVVLTSGTFLRGLMYVGSNKIPGGRMGDFSAQNLSKSLAMHGIEIARMKTGTPPRILGRSIDFSMCSEQRGDDEPCLFAFYDTRDDNEFVGKPEDQKSCWITHTTAQTKDVISANISHSPLYSGEITGIGPRYCPSIEDKYVKFPDHDTHRIFLEPEGKDSHEWYINGISTSMPIDTQYDILKSIPALKNAEISRPAYAVEYDFAPPTQIDATLQSKIIENLFFAGQINGTSGYEEAAGQGLVAGINAAKKAIGMPMMTLGRHESYIGVLIDDLVTKGTLEPYRMFTSRAEYRLLLNHGSADVRLLEQAEKFGLVNKSRILKTHKKLNKILSWVSRLNTETFEGKRISDWLSQARSLETIRFPKEFCSENDAIKDEVIYRIKYAGYLEREHRSIKKTHELECVKIPSTFNYAAVKGLSNETRQKLATHNPSNLGQASRISGITPVDISLILVSIEKDKRSKQISESKIYTISSV